MRLRSHDEGFVAAPPGVVYEAVRDVGGYAAWWPGASAEGEGSVVLPLGRAGAAARPEGYRDRVGLFLALPSLHGSLEWYLERFDDGTIVHAILDVDLPGRRPARRLLRCRAALRDGLVGLKRLLERP